MLAAILLLANSQAETTLHGLFTDNMVIQRDKPIHVWGTAAPGQPVTVSFAGEKATTATSDRGNWEVVLGPVHAGTFRLNVDGSKHIELQNVAVGEVWICSGQSNMGFTLDGARNAAEEVASAHYPDIRLYHVPARTVDLPLKDVNAKWEVCTPDAAHGFSAVGYFFARNLYEGLRVPIGMIETDWGGTPAESWTPRSALLADPKLAHLVTNYDATLSGLEAANRKYRDDLAAYMAKSTLADSGNDGLAKGWADPGFDDTTWADQPVPGSWETALNLHFLGGAWYRRSVDVPSAWAGQDLKLQLGAIDDYDTSYFNGEQVGATGGDTPNSWTVQRAYTVPGRLVKAGRNVIAVRVWNQAGDGGMMGGAPIRLIGPDGASINLEGKWRFLIEKGNQIDPNLRQPQMPLGPGNPWVPCSLWNGMVSCLPPFSIRGAIWYQGESNADRAYQYRDLFTAMIQAWRDQFGQGDFPFEWVQLANFLARAPQPGDSDWAELREAQTMALKLPNTGMATAIDVGEADDIHPKNKQEVGRRLALIALNRTYGKRQEDSGPVFRRMAVDGGTVRLTFDHAEGLTFHGGISDGFAVAGPDRKWHWASARIDRGVVLLTCADVPHPVAVRYGWATNPLVTLYNQAGLPAYPFRTDDWPGVTAGRG